MSDRIRRAVILAGGQGARLRPYTITIPKPLVPVGDRAIIEILLGQLRAHGVERVTIAVNHMADLIQAYCGDGGKHGIAIDYVREDLPLGTVGPLRNIQDLPDDFLVMNGDILTDLDFSAFFASHIQSGYDLSISTFERESIVDFGVISADLREGIVTGFEEKPRQSILVSMGVYAFRRRLLEMVPKGRAFGFDQLVLAMLEAGVPIRSIPFSGYWMDIGRPDDYAKACEDARSLPFLDARS